MERLQKSRLHALAGALLFAIGVGIPVHAQEPEDLSRGVARISLVNGDVSVRRGDSGEWVAAAVNAPVMTEDQISTGPNSRAEVQFDASNVLRIGAAAEVRLTQLEANRYQMELGHGIVTFTVLRPTGVNIEVDTPSVSVRPSRQGVYRITVNDAGETTVMCRSGEVEVFTPSGSQWVPSGRVLMARGADGNAEYQVIAAPALDEWDRWNQSRDQVMTQSQSYRNVPPGVYGVEELDQHGDWVQADGYGSVWRPRVESPDWSPYSVGRWAWEDWYGWTWISTDPWGWAPYHYGRWFNDPRFGWCWYPGSFGARHYWSPALVAFIGFGRGGGGVGFGFGNVGWVPLAPHEPFSRWWGRGNYGGFNRNINITNVNIYNTYRNARVRNGIASVAESDFRGGRFNRVARFSGDQVRDAGVVRGQMPIAPGSSHLRFSDREPGSSARMSRGIGRSFTQQRPAPAARTPFVQQQRAMEQGFRQEPDRRSNSERPNVESGWRRFGSPAGQSQAPVIAPRSDNRDRNAGRQPDRPSVWQSQPQQNRGGWQRFGEPGGASSRPQAVQPQREPQSIRTEPRVVRERQSFDSSRQPQVRERPSEAQPRREYQRPESPRQAFPRSVEAPRGGSRDNGSRQVSPPRSFGGGGGAAPRAVGGSGGGDRGNRGGGGGRRR